MRTLYCALAIALVGQPLAAQFPSDVAVGSRVQVVIPDSVRQGAAGRRQWLRGEVAALTADTLYLRLHATESPLAIRRAAIRRIDRSLGVPSRAESALRGAAGWVILGAFLGFATGWPDFDEGLSRRRWEDRAVLGAAAGAAGGFLLGAIFPTERWRRVRLR